MKALLVFIWLLSMLGLRAGLVSAQSPNPTFPTHSAPRFVRLEFENDVLQLRNSDLRDGNFTNGVKLEMMGNFWKNLPTRYILLEFPKDAASEFDYLYSFSIGQEMYTPRAITVSTIQRLDRPYAGWLYLSSGLVTVDVKKARKLSSSVYLGVVGPASLSGPVQTQVHKWINSPHPEGWGNQIRNAIGVGYSVRYEVRPIPIIHRSVDLISLVEGQVGSVTNFFGAGGMLRIGQFNDYFQNAVGLYSEKAYIDRARNQKLFSQAQERQDEMEREGKEPLTRIPVQNLSNRPFQAYAFMRPIARVVLDNSFLQGGWQRKSVDPYTIPSEDITHFYVTVEYGGVLAYKQIQLCYTQAFRTKEFQYGEQQQWGKISLLIGFQ